MSLYSGRLNQTSEIYKLTLAYRDLGIRKRLSLRGCSTLSPRKRS